MEALCRWTHPYARARSRRRNSFRWRKKAARSSRSANGCCARPAAKRRRGKKHINIAINLSPIQFRHGDLVGLVHSVLLETGLAPGRLELEITESVLIEDLAGGLAILRRLKALGVRIAMDDFGTGYSSLSYLQSFPVRQDQDRPVVHFQARHQPTVGNHRAGRCRPRARPRHAGGGRRRRNGIAARFPGGRNPATRSRAI